MAALQNPGTIRITALRGKTLTPGDPVELITGTTTENQTIFASGLPSGSFELKQAKLSLRNVPIPYNYTTLDGANVIYNPAFVTIGATQDSDYFELQIIK